MTCLRKLAVQGALVQRLFWWASISAKKPELSDVKYIEALIGQAAGDLDAKITTVFAGRVMKVGGTFDLLS